MARAHGSYPWCRGFESPSRYLTEKSVANKYGILAQLGEHLPYKQRVIGSSPDRFRYLKRKMAEIAQLARAHGSYPWCRGFESPSRYYTKDESVNRMNVQVLVFMLSLLQVFIQKYTKFLFTIAIIPKILYNAKR